MNMYVFESVQNLTSNYHSGGGLVVVAGTIKQAISMAQQRDVVLTMSEIESVIVYPLAAQMGPHVYIFPDAGCC